MASSAFLGVVAGAGQMRQACDFQVSQRSADNWWPNLLSPCLLIGIMRVALGLACEAVAKLLEVVQQEPLAKAWCTRFP